MHTAVIESVPYSLRSSSGAGRWRWLSSTEQVMAGIPARAFTARLRVFAEEHGRGQSD